jgi:uncharacterized protein YrrD
MKANKIAIYVAGVVSLGTAALLLADEETGTTRTPSAQTGTGLKTDDASQTQSPNEFNKASKLIGMEVRNEEGEKLGSIQDIVFDLDASRVSYAVLSSGGVLGVGDKLLAVPLSAFGRSTTDDKCLILRATTQNIRQAESIRDNWPAVQNPSFGAMPFWQKPGKANGTMGTQSTPD